jgi:CHAT domain-containing protein/tetratricopeptide (TPR) repeat protein
MRFWSSSLGSILITAFIALTVPAELAKAETADSVRVVINDLLDRAYHNSNSANSFSLDSIVMLADSAVVLAKYHYGPNDTAIASGLLMKAFYHDLRAHYPMAETLFNQAISIWQTNRGVDCLQQVRALGMLANCYSRQNKDVDAEKCYRRGIDLLDSAPEPNVAWLSLFLNCYAGLCQHQKRYDQAESLFRRALQVSSAKYGGDSYQTAVAYINLGRLLAEYRDDILSGEEYLRKALSYYDRTNNRDNYCPSCASEARLHLSQICYWLGKYDEASRLLEQAVEELTRLRGRVSIFSTEALGTAAEYEGIRGNWQKALEYAKELVEVREELDPHNAASLSASLFVLARCYYATGERQKSFHAFGRACELRQTFVNGAFSYSSEKSKMLYLRHFPLIDQSLLTIALADQGLRSIVLALQMELFGKGAILDAMSEERRIAFCSNRPEMRELVQRHAAVCDSIANNSVGHRETRNEEDVDQLALLNAFKDSLELELSRQCADFEKALSQGKLSIAEVAKALSAREVLWEYVRYRPYSFEHPDSSVTARYLAFTLDSRGQTTITDLGDAQTIDSLIGLVHQKIQDGIDVFMGAAEGDLERKLAKVTGQLSRLVFAPLQKTAIGCDQVFVSPDGQLSLLPFEILPLSDGRYAIEDYQFCYLSSGRDLLKYSSKPKSAAEGAMVVAAPDYESAHIQMLAQASLAVDAISGAHQRGPSDRSACLSIPFDPLPSSANEGKAIADILTAKMKRTVIYLSGTEASEVALKEMPYPPQILHLATHGYFCPKARFTEIGNDTESPLLYSGLAFAGCNQRLRKSADTTSEVEDGILTALEVSGLNLQGTDLVALSACQTGLGAVQEGEGVYGLRRAFQLAGARTIIMNMFSVPDKTASEVMTRFYDNWLSGTTKARAFRNAVLSVLRERRQTHGAAHPLFWGGFVLAGDPR